MERFEVTRVWNSRKERPRKAVERRVDLREKGTGCLTRNSEGEWDADGRVVCVKCVCACL